MEKKMDMVLDYVARMTQELVEMKQEMFGMKQIQQQHSQQLSSLQQAVTRIETVHGQKISALFDGYMANSEAIDRIERKTDTILDTVNTHEVQIRVIEKKAK